MINHLSSVKNPRIQNGWQFICIAVKDYNEHPAYLEVQLGFSTMYCKPIRWQKKSSNYGERHQFLAQDPTMVVMNPVRVSCKDILWETIP